VHYGKWFIIVIDYIDLKLPLGRLTEQQYKCVKDTIDIVYSDQLVFGNLRWPNILVGNDIAMLVNFNWYGKSGKAHYPNCDPSMGWLQMWDQIALYIFIMMIICWIDWHRDSSLNQYISVHYWLYNQLINCSWFWNSHSKPWKILQSPWAGSAELDYHKDCWFLFLYHSKASIVFALDKRSRKWEIHVRKRGDTVSSWF